MSLFDKFKKTKEDDLPVQAKDAVSVSEIAPLDVAKKTIKPVKKAKTDKIDHQAATDQPSAVRSDKTYGILIRPLITEKATNLARHNQYVFEISKSANKIQVAQAIVAKYGIKPIKVNVLNNDGKITRRGRSLGRTKDWKKAIVTLPEGQSIQIHEGV